jgi:hypothetical protein
VRPDTSQVLDEALARLRAGATVEECLRAYPDYAAELEPMLQTAVAIQRHTAAALPPSLEQWLAEGRHEIEKIARERYRRPEPLKRRFARQLRDLLIGLFGRGAPRFISAALSALVICFMTFYTVDAAAIRSLPGESLYGWKLFAEQTRINLATDPDQRAQLFATSVERRVAELGELAERPDSDPARISQALDHLTSQVGQALSALPTTSPAVRDSTTARIGRLLVRAETDLRGATPADQPPTDTLQTAAAEVASLIESLPAPAPVDVAAVVPARSPTATSGATPRPGASAPAGAALPSGTIPGPELGTPIASPNQPAEANPAAPDGSPAPDNSQSPALLNSGGQPTPSATRTPQPSVTRIPQPSATRIPQPSATRIPQPSATRTPEPSATPTPEPSATPTSEPSATPIPEPSATQTATRQPTQVRQPSPTINAIANPDVPPTNTATPTATATPTVTATPIEVDTPTPTATATVTPTSDTTTPIGVRPILECIIPDAENNEHYIAYFGYLNSYADEVEIPIGPSNRFASFPQDRGQPTTFSVGRSTLEVAFEVSSDGSTLVWILDGRTATASRSSRICGSPMPTP